MQLRQRQHRAWVRNNSESANWYRNATNYSRPHIPTYIPRETRVKIHRLRLGYRCCWEIEHRRQHTCQHCDEGTRLPLLHYLLKCPWLGRLRGATRTPEMQPTNPEAPMTACNMVYTALSEHFDLLKETVEEYNPPR